MVNVAPDPKNRSIESEVAFIGLPGRAGWLGFRRVLKVNGRHRLHQRVDGREKIHGIDTAWVEPSTGRLMRAQVKTRDARIGVLPFDAIIQVDFRLDEKLGLLVPYEMKEEFFAGRFREGTGTARYSNYRQFRTMTRIVQ